MTRLVMQEGLVLIALALCAGGAHAQAEPTLPQLDEAEANDAFARMDSDRDGQLSFEEFMKGIARPYGAQREGVVYQRLPARFRVLDADADGFLDDGEYAGLAQRWQGKGAPPTLADADRDDDGRIDFREFARLHVPHGDEPADEVAAAPPPAPVPPTR